MLTLCISLFDVSCRCCLSSYVVNSPRLQKVKSLLFGARGADEDEHKTALFNPTYENPGYVDMEDDEVLTSYVYFAWVSQNCTICKLAKDKRNLLPL